MTQDADSQIQTIRIATIADLDDITAVAVAALHQDPINPYRFPRWQELPEEYARFTRLRLEVWIRDPGNITMVCEVSGNDADNIKKIVAFSIWELPPPQQQKARQGQSPGVDLGPTRADVLAAAERGGNLARINAVAEEMGRARKEYFETPYGDKAMYLSILGCHPGFQRRGIGKQLVSWGLEKAKQEDLTLTVFGSPMGAQLYRKIGFGEVAKSKIQVEGDEEYIEASVMVLESKDIP